MARRTRTLVTGLLALSLFGPSPFSTPDADAACRRRVLVLAAFPAELGPLLGRGLGGEQRIRADGHTYYVGRMAGHDVVLAMTGIGLVNATTTTDTAFRRFRCGDSSAISSVVFSGVAGGGPHNFIGDVTVPERWTLDGGQTWRAVDPSMLAAAATVANSGTVRLARRNPLGDPACACIDPGLIKTVDMGRQPRIRIGGGGSSADTFDGRAFPCVAFGGDTFGCQPCRDQLRSGPDLVKLVGLTILLDPRFILANIVPPPAASATFVAVDMETAAAHKVAAAHGAPFLAFRAVSDGHGDPLHLPGFPVQFFFYKQLAADNAAAATLAFLRAWPGP
jgi:nucleoside phosphorylase